MQQQPGLSKILVTAQAKFLFPFLDLTGTGPGTWPGAYQDEEDFNDALGLTLFYFVCLFYRSQRFQSHG